MGALVFYPHELGQDLKGLRSRTRGNPPRMPKEMARIFEGISQWAKPSMDWLTENAKMDKPVGGSRWVIRGVSFMPAKDFQKFFLNADGTLNNERLSKFNVTSDQIRRAKSMCQGATEGCKAVCLATAGQMGLPASTQAQIRRQIVYQEDLPGFMAVLVTGIAKLYASARKQRARLGIRLNVTSDLDWENMPVQIDPWMSKWLKNYGVSAKAGKYPNIMRVFKNVLFYDYTKVPKRMLRFMAGDMPRNYHLTWSLAETPYNREIALEVLRKRKSTVSVPFDIIAPKAKKGEDPVKKLKKTPLPRSLTIVDTDGTPYTFPVVDADKHDLRPKDPAGTISGLRFKVPKPRGRAGMSQAQKIAAAGQFVVKTGGSKHPVIYVRGPGK